MKSWITPSILRSVKIKIMHYKKFSKSLDKSWYDKYKHYRGILNSLKSKNKKSHKKRSGLRLMKFYRIDTDIMRSSISVKMIKHSHTPSKWQENSSIILLILLRIF